MFIFIRQKRQHGMISENEKKIRKKKRKKTHNHCDTSHELKRFNTK